MSGRRLCKVAQEAPNAHFVKEKQCVTTTLLPPRHRDKQNTGTRTTMPRQLDRRLLAVASVPSGSAPHAGLSGEPKLQLACNLMLVVRNAVKITRLQTGLHSPHLRQRNTHCCWNGTLRATLKAAFIPKLPLLAAKRWCIGSAAIALRDNCTCTK